MADAEIHRRCYVYEIIVDGVVRYIGKGTRRRAQGHIAIAKTVNQRRAAGERVKTQKFYNQLARALREGADVSHRIVLGGLTTNEAFDLEIAAIAAAPTGQLWNVLPGGQGADSEHFKRVWRERRDHFMAIFGSPEARERGRARANKQWEDEDARRRNSERTRAQWADPEFRATRVEALRQADSPERRAALSAATKAQWADPEKAQRRREAIRAARRTPEQRARASSAAKEMWSKPGARERYGKAISQGQKASGKLKAVWKDPAHREKMRKAMVAGWVKRRAKNSM